MIREKSGGLLEGQKLEVPKKMAAQKNINIRDFKPEKGESWKDVYQRAAVFIDKLIATHFRGEDWADNHQLGMNENTNLSVHYYQQNQSGSTVSNSNQTINANIN